MKYFKAFAGLSLLALAACSQQVPSDEVPEPTEQTEQPLAPKAEAPRAQAPKAEAREHVRKGAHRGPGFMLRAALKELELSPAQVQKIEGLLTELDSAHPAESPSHQAFDQALAAGVRAGKLDRAALEPHFTALDKSASEGRKKVHAALNELHRTLDAEQRKSLVAALEARTERGDKGRHAFGDEQACGGDGQCDHAGKRGFGRRHGPGPGMFHDLDLTDAQREKLQSALPDRAAMKGHMKKKGEHMKQLLAAFAGDGFDADKLAADADKSPRAHAEARVEHLQALLGVLEPAQREKLAARVESGPRGRH
ncbi:MAG: Spy/CpxP family protein refolding chaperone [Polyangiaceae bacterium]|nr:Spy/CpxP family protein refolding chaperone [Polyangiaceae bacterium]